MLGSGNRLDLLLVVLSLFFVALMAGFFFAWSCSTMLGLDMIEAQSAITAMNAINISVRNPIFLLPFLLAPILLIINGVRGLQLAECPSALYFFLAAFYYLIGVVLVTLLVSEPLNYQLAKMVVSASSEKNQLIWISYSTKWQRWNLIRTIFSSLAFILSTIASLI